MPNLHRTAYKQALAWYLDHGVDEALVDSPQKHARDSRDVMAEMRDQPQEEMEAHLQSTPTTVPVTTPLLGKTDAQAEAVKIAQDCETLDDLRQAMADFEGVALKKTATNMVFAEGNPEAPVMLIGEAPGADEDRQGRPFVGLSGQLLDRILASIGLGRAHDNPLQAVYLTNVLNWRPPGNRTPAQSEIAVSLPFVERHIQLAAPKILVLCGGVAAKVLLGRDESISKLRSGWHDYRPQIPELAAASDTAIPAIVTYHPAYLLKTPVQKKAVWRDMLRLQDKCRGLDICK